MNLLRPIVLLTALGCWPDCSRAQYRPLPELITSRRADSAYMDSMAHVAKQRYRDLTALPHTARKDTLRFKTLYYLGRLYRWWDGRKDSTLYFSNELITQARKSQNLFYEVNSKLLIEEYYHVINLNTPQALRLNFEVLAILPKTSFYDNVRYHVNRNLGNLYGISRDYASALRYLTQAKNVLDNNTPYLSATLNSFRIDVEQHIGFIYRQQDNFAESEKHYRAAESLLTKSSSEAEHAYVYDDLGELYLKYKLYEQALVYAKKAESIWQKIKPRGESNSWGTLACIYTGLGQDELGFHYAEKALQATKSTKFVREQAYMALYQLFDRRQDWKNSSFYFKKYVATRDTIRDEQRSNELASIQKQTEFELLTIQNQQAQQLQAQRLLTVSKQAELDRLRSSAEADALAKKARLSEQQRQLENERAQAELNRQQTTQRLQQQSFEQKDLQQKNEAQQNLIFSITSSSLLLLGVLALLLYSAQLRKRKAEADLRLAHVRKEADTRIIQTQESERQRVAADLHDDLGGTLATLRRRIADIRLHLRDPQAAHQLDDLEPLIQKSNDDLRRIAHNLMPPEFARIGLRDSIRQLVSSQPPQPTHFSFITSGSEQKLPLETELNIYRIVSELIQNINKHAQAKRAAIQLLYHNDYLTATIEDDGLGNRLAKTDEERTGIGLKNSSLRAEYIGARLWREASEGGTLVVLDVPYLTTANATQRPDPSSAD